MKHEMKGGHHYGRLALMFLLHFIAMYWLMYAMVHNLTANVYNSVNQVYMAGLMTASMGVIEIALMGSMYGNKKRNVMIVAVSAVALLLCWVAIRKQSAIGDKQFIRSMIPHHSGAILMCQQSAIEDAELKKLCGEIVQGQQQEIDQMKSIMERLDK